MSDRTYAQVIVYDCPEDQRAAALEAILSAFGDSPNEGPTIGGLVLGERYGADQCAGDTSDSLAADLIKSAPGAAFIAWTDPAYDWLGSLVTHAPGLGSYAHDCDSYGIPMFGPAEVWAIIAKDRIARRVALGTAWLETIEEARGRLAEAGKLAAPIEAAMG